MGDQPDVSVYDPNTFCISQRIFAIGIAIAGLILMTAVVVAIMILVSKRRRKNLSTTGSSIYSGPYTNTAYSHSSMSRRSSNLEPLSSSEAGPLNPVRLDRWDRSHDS